MLCPLCKADDSRVVDSRTVEGGVRRRRECLACLARFTTYERIEAAGVQVVKRDGRREAFSAEKLLGGIRRACEKRPLASGAVEAVATEVQRAVFGRGLAEIGSGEIGEIVMARLRDLDQIAYVRFASVYRQFADLGGLRAVMDELDATAAADSADAGTSVLLAPARWGGEPTRRKEPASRR